MKIVRILFYLEYSMFCGFLILLNKTYILLFSFQLKFFCIFFYLNLIILMSEILLNFYFLFNVLIFNYSTNALLKVLYWVCMLFKDIYELNADLNDKSNILALILQNGAEISSYLLTYNKYHNHQKIQGFQKLIRNLHNSNNIK